MLSTAPSLDPPPHPARTEAGKQVGAAAWTLRLTGRLTVAHPWCKSVNGSAAASSEEARGAGAPAFSLGDRGGEGVAGLLQSSMVQGAPWTGFFAGPERCGLLLWA